MRRTYGILAGMLIMGWLAAGCVGHGVSPAAEPPVEASTVWQQGNSRADIHLLFIHGTPGSRRGFADYLNDKSLQDEFALTAIDRPGFGEDPGPVIPQLRQQAKSLAAGLSPEKRNIVIGHSLGAPLAVWLALQSPEQVAAIVLVAGSMAPELEPVRWYNWLAQWQPVQWFLSREWIHANREMMVLQDELRLLEPELKALRVPVVVVQGGRDELVLPETVDFLRAQLPSSLLAVRYYPEEGHFILWQRPDLIAAAIREAAETIR